MTSTQLRKKLHRFIDSAEDKKLKAIYVMVEDDIEVKSLLSEKQKAELDRRYEEYLQGKGRDYTWDEVKMKIKKTRTRS